MARQTALSKKHYVRTAEILREHLPDSEDRLPVAQAFADYFAADNGKFDRGRFVHAVETGTGLSRASNAAAEVAREERIERHRRNQPRLDSVKVEYLHDLDPDLSYLYGDESKWEGLEEAEVSAAKHADSARLDAYNRGDWYCVGIRAVATILVPSEIGEIRQTIESGGLWGIESDSDLAYLREVESEEVASLSRQLAELGIHDAPSFPLDRTGDALPYGAE